MQLVLALLIQLEVVYVATLVVRVEENRGSRKTLILIGLGSRQVWLSVSGRYATREVMLGLTHVTIFNVDDDVASRILPTSERICKLFDLLVSCLLLEELQHRHALGRNQLWFVIEQVL